MYLKRELEENILVAKIGLLQAETTSIISSGPNRQWRQCYLSAVNLFSLKAVMKEGDNRKARKLRLPCELRLTSCTKAIVLSLSSFW